MIIKDPLLDPFFIIIEDDCFTLKESCTYESGKNVGQEYEKTLGHYMQEPVVLRKIILLKLARTEQVVDLKKWFEMYSQLTTQLKNLLTDGT